MRVIVINPVQNETRRRFQSAQALRLGLDVEFMGGVSADALPCRVLQNAANEWTRGVRGLDIACTFSHWSVWEEVAAGREKVCILEDDVLLADNFKAVLDFIDARQDAWNCVYDLEYATRPHTLSRSTVWHDENLKITSRRIYKNKRGAAAYILGPEAAQRLLDEAKQYAMMESFLWTRRWMRQMQIEPCPAVQLDVFDPVTAAEMQHYKRLSDRVVRMYKNSSWLRSKLKRLNISLNESALFLQGCLKGKRRPLLINSSDFQAPGQHHSDACPGNPAQQSSKKVPTVQPDLI